MSGVLLARQGRIKDKYGLTRLMGVGFDYGQGLHYLPPHSTARCIRYTPAGSNTGPTVIDGRDHYTRTTLAGCKALVRVCPTGLGSQGTAISALTSSGTTATATVASTTGIISGVTKGLITGANPAVFNGFHTLTVVNGTTLTYQFAGNSNNPAAVWTAVAYSSIGLKFGYGDRVLLPSGTVTYGDQYGEFAHAQGINEQYPFLFDTYDVADPTNVARYGKLQCTLDMSAKTYPLKLATVIGRQESFFGFRSIYAKAPSVDNQGGLVSVNGRHHRVLFEKCVVEGSEVAVQGNAQSLVIKHAVTSLTSVGTTATLTLDNPIADNFVTGMKGTVSGAGVANFNKLATFTKVSPTVLTYPITDSGGVDGGGTPRVQFAGSAGDFRGAMDLDMVTDLIVNHSGLGYANPKASGRAQGLYSDMTRGIHLWDSVFHHGGHAATALRNTAQMNWDAGSSLAISSLSQVGGVATAVVASTALLTTGERLLIGGATESGSLGTYNFCTPITVVDATTFTYEVDPATYSPATGTPVYYRAEAGTWNGDIGHSPNIFNHGWYISQGTDDINVIDCINSFDASNAKCTGGEWYVRRLCSVYNPIGEIWNNWGNEVNSWTLATCPPVRVFDQLQMGSDDINNDTPRGMGPTFAGVQAGSISQNALLLVQDNANAVNRSGISAGLPAMTTIPSVINVRHYITGNWGNHIAADEGSIVKTWAHCITEDASALTGTKNFKRTTTCPASMQAKITDAQARTIAAWKAVDPDLASVSVGADDEGTALNVMDYCFRNPAHPWAVKLQRYVREPLGR